MNAASWTVTRVHIVGTSNGYRRYRVLQHSLQGTRRAHMKAELGAIPSCVQKLCPQYRRTLKGGAQVITFPIWLEGNDWHLPREFTPWSADSNGGFLGFQEYGNEIQRMLFRLGLKKGAKKATVSIVYKPTKGFKRCVLLFREDGSFSNYLLVGSKWCFCVEGIEKYFVPFGKGKYKGWVKVK